MKTRIQKIVYFSGDVKYIPQKMRKFDDECMKRIAIMLLCHIALTFIYVMSSSVIGFITLMIFYLLVLLFFIIDLVKTYHSYIPIDNEVFTDGASAKMHIDKLLREIQKKKEDDKNNSVKEIHYI